MVKFDCPVDMSDRSRRLIDMGDRGSVIVKKLIMVFGTNSVIINLGLPFFSN